MPLRRRRRLGLFLAATMVVPVVASTVMPAGTASAYTTVVYNGAGSAPRIGIIGDSTIAALRWTNRFEPLKRFNFVYDAESCRRTVGTSCRGREGYTPDNVISTMRRLSGQWGSVLVIMGGYDDPGYGFASAIDAVMTEAARQGIPKVMWLTLRTADVSYVGPGFLSNTYTFRDNNRILLQQAPKYGGRLQIADWATYSASRSDWFYSDGIHLTFAGSDAAASFIASQAARVIGGETITPAPGVVPILPWVSVRRGDRGASVVAVQRALLERGYSVFGGLDGVFGSATEALLRRFQAANGLPVTGVVDSATAARLGLNNAGGTAAPATWVDLRYGMGGTGVAAAQRALMEAGIFVRGGADGVFSVYTMYAVQTFQRGKGLAATGVLDAATAKALGLYSGNWIDLRLGMSGTSVRSAQEALIRGGIHVAGGATGTFSVGTYYAVRTFQRYQGLPVTGIIDGPTARALAVLVAPTPASVWSNLGVTARGARVAAAQRALMNAGIFVRGGATGEFTVYTLYAVNTFQRQRGLRVTGVIDADTARALGLFDVDDPTVTWRDLRLGSFGDAVTRAEQALIAAGVYVAKGVDGSFGVDTYYAVLTYQRYHNLPVTGIVDYATAQSLGLFSSSAATTLLAASAVAAPLAATSLTAETAPESTVESTTTTSTTVAPSTSTSTTVVANLVPTAAASAVETGDSSVAPTYTFTIGDLVWLDANGNGIQDPTTDVGIEGVVVVLLDASGAELSRDVTDRNGTYEFTAPADGSYLLEVELPDSYEMTLANQGIDDEADSDLTTPAAPRGLTRTVRTDAFDGDPDVGTGLDLGLVAVPSPPASEPSTSAPDDSVATEPAPTQESVSSSVEPTTTGVGPSSTESPSTEPSTTAPVTTVAATTTSAPEPPATTG